MIYLFLFNMSIYQICEKYLIKFIKQDLFPPYPSHSLSLSLPPLPLSISLPQSTYHYISYMRMVHKSHNDKVYIEKYYLNYFIIHNQNNMWEYVIFPQWYSLIIFHSSRYMGLMYDSKLNSTVFIHILYNKILLFFICYIYCINHRNRNIMVYNVGYEYYYLCIFLEM